MNNRRLVLVIICVQLVLFLFLAPEMIQLTVVALRRTDIIDIDPLFTHPDSEKMAAQAVGTTKNNEAVRKTSLHQRATKIQNFTYPTLQKADIEVNGHGIFFNTARKNKSSSKIRIHLVFHSHVDPGWLKTFEAYYEDAVKKIISNAVAFLVKHPISRFIWSETSYLERWWKDATDQERKNIKDLVRQGHLEVSSGSWVMTDEACPTYYAAIENLIEGHSFVKNTLGVTPNTSWSVDPFGHGSMMPELWHLAGVDSMVIGRFHHHLKKSLREKQALRWKWVGKYSEDFSGPSVNSLPHHVYTTEDSCPDKKISQCFRVGPSSHAVGTCVLGANINLMTLEDLQRLSANFVEQMRLVQSYYGTEDILVPIGDDFFFTDIQDFEQTFNGFSQIQLYLKQRPDWGAEIRFSTVSDFFNAIRKEEVPTLKGDFFPYTQNKNKPSPWWSGFFVHRSYHKIMERRLQNVMRSWDLVTVLYNQTEKNFELLKEAKRELLLFQHHDGITGTSKVHVMEDYEKRMQRAFSIFESNFLLTVSPTSSTLTHNASTSSPRLIRVDQSKYLKVLSSSTVKARQLVELLVDRPVEIKTVDGKELIVYTKRMGDHFLAEFVIEIEPLSIASFMLLPATNISYKKPQPSCFKFNPDGSIQSFFLNGKEMPFQVSLINYEDYGGAYVMELHPESRQVRELSSYFDEMGPLLFRRTYYDKENYSLSMTATCLPSNEVDINITTDLTAGTTFLLFKTTINHTTFHTDVNGLYHIERKHLPSFVSESKLVEANVFPVATSVFVQDEKMRMTILTGQPTGASSERPGEMMILMDRRVKNNDGKGLDYGDSFDNHTSILRYRILFESRQKTPQSSFSNAYHSPKGEAALNSLLYPPITFVSNQLEPKTSFSTRWPCGIQLVTWRPISTSIDALVLRRVAFEDSLGENCNMDDADFSSLYKSLQLNYKKVHHAKLSATEDGSPVTVESFLSSLKQFFSIVCFRLHK